MGFEGKKVLRRSGPLVSAEALQGSTKAIEALPDLVDALPRFSVPVVGRRHGSRPASRRRPARWGVADRVTFTR
jgi:hypothetical protein